MSSLKTVHSKVRRFIDQLKHFYSGKDVSYRFILSLVFPVVLDQFFLVSFNFINTAMISSAGTTAVSAVSMVGSLHFFLVNVFTAIGLGGTVLMAQYFGKKEMNQLSKVCSGTVYGAVLMALVISSLIACFHQGILQLLFGHAEPLVLANARLYLLGLLASYPLQAVIEGTNGSLRGIGRTKASLKLSLLMNFVYIVGNVCFISILGMGMEGLVTSLLISRFLGMLFAFYTLRANRFLFLLKKEDFLHIQLHVITKVLKVSVPFAVESLFFNGGKIIIQTMIVSFGTNVIATNAIASSWIQISEIIPSALATSLVPIVGQCIGRENIADAKKLTKTFVITGMIAFLLVDLILLPFFPLGMKLFNPPAAILPEIYRLYLIAIVMHFLTWSICFILPSALRAAGDANFTSLTSLLSMWIFRIGMGYFVGIVLGYGLTGIYFVMTLEWGGRGLIFLLRFKGKKWYQHQLT